MQAQAMGKQVHSFFNAIEDAYVEREMAKRYPGSGFNLRTVGEFFLKNVTDKLLAEKKISELGILLVPAIRAMSGQPVYQDYMDKGNKWATISQFMDKCGDYLKEALPKITCSADGLAVTLEVKRLLEEGRETPPDSGEPDEDDGSEDGERSFDNSGDSLFDENKSPEKPEPEGEGDDGEKDEEEPEPAEPSESESKDGPAPEDTPETDPESPGEDEAEGEDESEDSLETGAEGDSDEPQDGDTQEGEAEGEGESAGESGEDSGEGEGSDSSEGVSKSKGDEDSEEGPEKAGESEDEDKSYGQGVSGVDEKNEDHKKPLTWGDMSEVESTGFDDGLSEALSEASTAAAKEADYLVYSRDFDTIETLEVPDRMIGSSVVNKMVDAVDHMIGPLQKDLERAVAARSAATWSSGHRSGRLNSSALARLTAFKDDRAFRRKHENKSRDVAVSLLIDCSGSMCGPEIRTAAYAAYGLSSVLERLNINNEVLGFTTRGSMGGDAAAESSRTGVRYSRVEPIYMPVFKEFSERMTQIPKARIASMIEANWLYNNIDGESVQYAGMRLARRSEQRKILIVLSDGHPSARTMQGKQVLDEHLRKVVRELVKDKVEVLGIGIVSDAVRSYYPKSVVLNDLRDLPTSVIGEVKKLLTQP